MKKMLIAGASGMVGNLVQEKALNEPEVGEVLSLVRRGGMIAHPKLTEKVVTDFLDYSGSGEWFKGVDMAFFCIGVYTGQVPKEEFKQITLDYAVAFGEALKTHSPSATLCLLSGAGADRTEASRMAFAKYKGMAENQLSALGLGGFYSFRPAYIYPVTPREEPSWVYRLTRALYPLIKLMGENSSIKSTELASSMLRVGLQGAESEVLENRDILKYV